MGGRKKEGGKEEGGKERGGKEKGGHKKVKKGQESHGGEEGCSARAWKQKCRLTEPTTLLSTGVAVRDADAPALSY